MNLLRYLTSLLPALALLLAGCGEHYVMPDIPEVPGNTDRYRAGFYVSLGDIAASRAPSPGDYLGGSADENYIDITGGDYAVLFFDRSDRYLGRLTNPTFEPVAGDPSLKTYELKGDIDANAMNACGGTFKVMILANWRHVYPDTQYGITTVSEVCGAAAASYTFDFSTDMAVGADRPIPMYGITNLYTGITFDEASGYYRDLGTIHLLRAYAKIQVIDNNPACGITSVTLTRAHSTGMKAPLGVTTQNDYVHNSYDADYRQSPSIPAQAPVATDIKLIQDGNTWTAYVPEFRNIEGSDPLKPLGEDKRARLFVELDNEALGHRYIDFKYYDNPPEYAPSAKKGDHFNICRNNWYRFTVKSISEEKEIEVEVDVQPYSAVELDPIYGLERDPDTGWIIIRDNGVISNYFCDKYGQYYNKDKQPIATRLERVDGLFIQPENNSRKMRYAYDPVADKYYLDTRREVELTNPTQLKFELSPENHLILMVDRYGVAIYFYDPVNDRYYNENNTTLTPSQALLGLQRYRNDPNLVVTSLTFSGSFRYICDAVTDDYYELTDDNRLVPVEAYPPKKANP